MENKFNKIISKKVKKSRPEFFIWHLAFCLLPLAVVAESARAQTFDSPQLPNPADTTPPRQPAPLPEPQPLPPSLDRPSIPAPVPPPSEASPNGPSEICINGFAFEGNTAFTNEELNQVIRQKLKLAENTMGCFNITWEKVIEAREAVNEHYKDKGFVTTGAYIPQQDVEVEGGTVKIRVVEGELEEIRVSGNRRLNPNYVRSRIEVAAGKPLNRDRLIEALQLLRLDPLIDTVTAELSAGSSLGENILEVRIIEANPFNAGLSFDNNRSPSAGSFRRSANFRHGNLFGLGDALSATYRNTDGSNELDVNYTVPVNARNGAIAFGYRTSESQVIEEPFSPLDIQANYRSYELTLSQPVIQQVERETVRELALGLTAQRQETETSILGEDFPLSPGADSKGRTRISALRFFQEFSQRGEREVFAARSEFSLGLGALDATVNSEPPDSRFFAWRGQVQWLRLLDSGGGDALFAPSVLLRSDVQLASKALVPLEQFSLGGQATVRGYRQDALLGDNGILVSAEVRLPVAQWRRERAVLQLVPFVGAGTIWNSSGRENPDTNTLAGVGLGVQFLQGDRFRARFDWGIPLVDIDSGNRTWQENGLYFTVEYNFF